MCFSTAYYIWRDLFSLSINGDFLTCLHHRPASLSSLFLCGVSDWIVWSTRRVVSVKYKREKRTYTGGRCRLLAGRETTCGSSVYIQWLPSSIFFFSFSYNSLPFISNKNTSSINVTQNINFLSMFKLTQRPVTPHQHLPDRRRER